MFEETSKVWQGEKQMASILNLYYPEGKNGKKDYKCKSDPGIFKRAKKQLVS